MSKTIAVAEFAAHPVELLEEATKKQEEVVVLKDGKPIGKLVPTEWPRPMTIEELRSLGGRVLGDIVEPLDESAELVPTTGRPRKTLEEMRAEGVKILGDIMEPFPEWDMTR